MSNSTPTPQSRVSLVTFLGLLTLLTVICFRMIAPYLLTVFMGCILALLTYGIYQRLSRRTKWPKLSALAVTVGILVMLIGPISLFISTAVEQGLMLAANLRQYKGFSFRGVFDRLAAYGPVQLLIGDPDALERQLRTTFQTVGRALSGAVFSVAAAIPQLGLHLVLALLSCFFFLVDGRRFLNWMGNKIPLDSDVRRLLAKSFEDTTISTIWATLVAAATQATVMTFAFLILGVPAAFLAGGATFIFAWVPVLGSVPIWVAGSIYLFTQGSVAKGVAMIGFGLFTGVIDNFIRPIVLKGRSDMHPLVALVAIFGGVYKFGIFGVFYGPILAAILISLLRIWPVVGARAGLQFEQQAVRAGNDHLQEAKKVS